MRILTKHVVREAVEFKVALDIGEYPTFGVLRAAVEDAVSQVICCGDALSRDAGAVELSSNDGQPLENQKDLDELREHVKTHSEDAGALWALAQIDVDRPAVVIINEEETVDA